MEEALHLGRCREAAIEQALGGEGMHVGGIRQRMSARRIGQMHTPLFAHDVPVLCPDAYAVFGATIRRHVITSAEAI